MVSAGGRWVRGEKRAEVLLRTLWSWENGREAGGQTGGGGVGVPGLGGRRKKRWKEKPSRIANVKWPFTG